MLTLNGRTIEAYLVKEDPSSVIIAVLQKEGDCPENFPRERREVCPLDCRNNYMVFNYSIPEGRIVQEGMLYSGVPIFTRSAVKKYGITPNNSQQFLKQHKKEIQGFTPHLGQRILTYKGDVIANLIRCSLLVSEKTPACNEEQRKYAEWIRKTPKQVIKECGIDIKKKWLDSLLTGDDLFKARVASPNNIRSIRYFNNVKQRSKEDRPPYVA